MSDLTAYYDLAKQLASLQAMNAAQREALAAIETTSAVPGTAPIDRQTTICVIDNFPEDRMAIADQLNTIQQSIATQQTLIEQMATQVGQLANAGGEAAETWTPPALLNPGQMEYYTNGSTTSTTSIQGGYYNSSTKLQGRGVFAHELHEWIEPTRVLLQIKAYVERGSTSYPWWWPTVWVHNNDDTMWKNGNDTRGLQLSLQPHQAFIDTLSTHNTANYFKIFEIPLATFNSWGNEFYLVAGQNESWTGNRTQYQLYGSTSSGDPTYPPLHNLQTHCAIFHTLRNVTI